MCGYGKHKYENLVNWGYQAVHSHDGEFEHMETWETWECVTCGDVHTFGQEGISDTEFHEWRDYHRKREAENQV